MKAILTCICMCLLLAACTPKPLPPENGPDHPVQLPPPTVPDDPDYDPHLLVPHYNAEKKLWGYIDRTSREVVIPYMFAEAGVIQREYGLATAWDDEWTKEDIYRITPDGKYKLIHEGKPEYGISSKSTLAHKRTEDDYLYVHPGNYYALYDPQGNKLWDTVAPPRLFSMGGSLTGYLAEGHTALLNRGNIEIRDRSFKTIARFDTTKYALYLPDFRDWIQKKHQIPLIVALDLENEKVGFVDHFGKVRIPFEYDYWPGIDIRNVRTIYRGGRAREFIYRANHHGQIVVWKDSTHCLITEDNEILYHCPDTLSFATDPRFDYNATENSVILTVWNDTLYQFVLDLDDHSISFTGSYIKRLSDSRYTIEASEGMTPTRQVDASGKAIPSWMDREDGAVSVRNRRRPDCSFWSVRRNQRSGIIDTTGKLAVLMEYDGTSYYENDRTSHFIEVWKKNYDERDHFLFLYDGTQVAGPMRCASSMETNSTELTNTDFRFQAIANTLFYARDRYCEPPYRGFFDAYGHSFISLEPLSE